MKTTKIRNINLIKFYCMFDKSARVTTDVTLAKKISSAGYGVVCQFLQGDDKNFKLSRQIKKFGYDEVSGVHTFETVDGKLFRITGKVDW